MATRPHPTSTRLITALLLIGAVVLWWSQQPIGPDAPSRPSIRTGPGLGPRASATVEATAPPAETGPTPRVFAEGFCGPNDDEGTFTLKFSVRGQIGQEINRRLMALSDVDRSAVLNALGPFIETGTVPPGVAATDLLLEATQREVPPTRLLELAEQVATRNPTDPYVQAARAVAANLLDRPAIELDAVRRARAGLPQEPALGWALARLTRHTPAIDDAIAGLDAYLAADPLPVLARMRARLIVQRDIQRGYLQRSSEGVTLLWPPDALADAQVDATLRAIIDSLDGVARLIGTPRRPTLTAVVYPSRSELFAVTCVPGWVDAVYDGTLRLVAAPEQPTGVGLLQLRHESTHAQLTPTLPTAPTWFQEGLAQYFAGSDNSAKAAWKLMVQNRTWIPFESLDGSFHIFDKPKDAELAYAESLALVELMAARGGSDAMARAVKALREGATTSAVVARVVGQSDVSGEDLLGFLAEKMPPAGGR